MSLGRVWQRGARHVLGSRLLRGLRPGGNSADVVCDRRFGQVDRHVARHPRRPAQAERRLRAQTRSTRQSRYWNLRCAFLFFVIVHICALISVGLKI